MGRIPSKQDVDYVLQHKLGAPSLFCGFKVESTPYGPLECCSSAYKTELATPEFTDPFTGKQAKALWLADEGDTKNYSNEPLWILFYKVDNEVYCIAAPAPSSTPSSLSSESEEQSAEKSAPAIEVSLVGGECSPYMPDPDCSGKQTTVRCGMSLSDWCKENGYTDEECDKIRECLKRYKDSIDPSLTVIDVGDCQPQAVHLTVGS